MGKIDSRALLWLLACLAAGACQHVGLAGERDDGGPDGDTDSDSDADSDSDSDADADSDDTETVLCGSILCPELSYVTGDSIGELSGCTHATGDLFIDDTTTAELWALEALRCVDGDLDIDHCEELENLDALSNLIRVGGRLNIGSLPPLGNPALASVAGLAGVTSTVVDITVVENSSLESLDGLYNVEGITGRLDVRYNDKLTEISGLSSIHHSGDVIMIMYNGCLPAEEAESVQNAMISGGFSGDVYVHDNGNDCN